MKRNSKPFIPIKGKPLSPFISKLKALLNDELRFHRAIRWSENGNAIVISDGETFKKLVLDGNEGEAIKMFKTKNFTSFVRQLNLYGFKKVPVNGKGNPSKNMKYENPNFRRESPELMHLVTCNPRKKKKFENEINVKQCVSKRISSFQGKSPHSNSKRYRYYSDECFGPDKENDSDTLSTDSSESSSERSTPTQNKEVIFTNSNFLFESTNQEAFNPVEVQEYLQLQEEQMVVQLLLDLKNTVPRPVTLTSTQNNLVNCEEFQPRAIPTSTVTNYDQAACPYSYYSTTPNFYTQYHQIY